MTVQPTTSLIIPVFNTQDYLVDCLASVLTDAGDDYEIIVVDDASTDASSRIIDSLASEHPAIRVVRLAVNGGLGNARNEGLAVATGEWVVFLDSDDTLVPGALTRVAAIQRTTEADLILFDYARAFPKGRTRRPSHTIVETLDGQVVTLAEHPELLAVLNVAWTKAYRRAFLDRVGTSFPAGYYEDIPWTYLLLAEAEGIRIMDQVVVLYRQQREGRILATPSDRHLDLLTQYERLFTELQRRGHSHYMTAMFDRMVEHSTFVLAQGTKRLSRQSQELFFANLTVLYNEWKPSELKIGPGLRRMRYAVVERGGRYRPVYRLLFLFRPLRVFKATFRSLTSAVAKLGKRPSIASPDIS